MRKLQELHCEFYNTNDSSEVVCNLANEIVSITSAISKMNLNMNLNLTACSNKDSALNTG